MTPCTDSLWGCVPIRSEFISSRVILSATLVTNTGSTLAAACDEAVRYLINNVQVTILISEFGQG